MVESCLKHADVTYSVSQLVFQNTFFFSIKTQQRDRGERGTSLGHRTLEDDDGFLSVGVCGLLVHTPTRLRALRKIPGPGLPGYPSLLSSQCQPAAPFPVDSRPESWWRFLLFLPVTEGFLSLAHFSFSLRLLPISALVSPLLVHL